MRSFSRFSYAKRNRRTPTCTIVPDAYHRPRRRTKDNILLTIFGTHLSSPSICPFSLRNDLLSRHSIYHGVRSDFGAVHHRNTLYSLYHLPPVSVDCVHTVAENRLVYCSFVIVSNHRCTTYTPNRVGQTRVNC